MQRSNGVILHISSLPGGYGIGSLGAPARAFIDRLSEAGVGYWQMLPLGPTAYRYGDSPYMARSAFAGNHYFIDLDELFAAGLLARGELPQRANATSVDFGALTKVRTALLRRAFARFRPDDAYAQFCAENESWLSDYALFSALTVRYKNRGFWRWPRALRFREPAALERSRAELSGEADFEWFCQYQFFSQYAALRRYAKDKNIGLIGDLPIYVPRDSADVWAHPGLFALDKNLRVRRQAGVPPDYFSKKGQLWGSPVYDWPNHERTGYRWWLRRMAAAAELFDIVRLDHFRGFASYWSVPAWARTAKKGSWKPGPGIAFIEAVHRHVPEIELIAEDLGHLTPDVYELLDLSGLRGMRVLQFSFSSEQTRAEAAAGFYEHLVLYAGTHDNDTAAGWLAQPGPAQNAAIETLGLAGPGDVFGFLEAGLASRADLFLCQMQDTLALGSQSRMNTPGTARGNWRWRLSEPQLAAFPAERLRELNQKYGR